LASDQSVAYANTEFDFNDSSVPQQQQPPPQQQLSVSTEQIVVPDLKLKSAKHNSVGESSVDYDPFD
jgi:hypothetical protein